MTNRIRLTAALLAAATIAAGVLLPGSAQASPGPKHVDNDHQPCVTTQEWKHVADRVSFGGHHPLASRVTDQWEVTGLGWDAVLDLSPWDDLSGIAVEGISSQAFPRCGYEDRPDYTWWGFVADENGRVTMLTGYRA